MKKLLTAIALLTTFNTFAASTPYQSEMKQAFIAKSTACAIGAIRYQDDSTVQCRVSYKDGSTFQASLYVYSEDSIEFTVNDSGNNIAMLNQAVRDVHNIMYDDESKGIAFADWLSAKPIAKKASDRVKRGEFTVTLPTQKSVLMYQNYLASMTIIK
ncbi:hypothetical protein [Vibrio owensii]|uniref:hypothetical protein n=1 Tax=Vibrio owensii TaxID=696485 RepID=UPI0018F10942|nr:hypothetical protein [Vibrio owensii]